MTENHCCRKANPRMAPVFLMVDNAFIIYKDSINPLSKR